MNREEFTGRLQSIIDLNEDCKAQVFFVMNRNGEKRVKKANIQRGVLTAISEAYRNNLANEIGKFADDAERDVLNLSDRDERANVIYRYDLPDEEPTFFASMRDVVAEHPLGYFTGENMFCFDDDSLSDLDCFVTELGVDDNKIVIYRNNFNVNLMKQARGRFYLNKSGTQFTTIDEDILRMDSQIDVMMIDDDFYVLNLSYLDGSKEFAGIIRSRAEASIAGIEGLNLVDSVDGLRERLSELSFARRLMRAMDSSPVTDMPAQDVIRFVSQHDTLSNVLKVADGRIKLSSKKAQDYFVRLMNDDFLHSQLTSQDYTSTSKNKLLQ